MTNNKKDTYMWLSEYLFCKFRFITSSSMSDMDVISGTPQLPVKKKIIEFWMYYIICMRDVWNNFSSNFKSIIFLACLPAVCSLSSCSLCATASVSWLAVESSVLAFLFRFYTSYSRSAHVPQSSHV